MNPELLEQIDRIFHRALDLPPDRRGAFLDEACANDSHLRSEIESLISAHEHSGDFIESSAAGLAALLLRGKALHGKQVAQFQVDALLGSGGMGDVYAATDRMGRRVALKVLAPRLVENRQHVTRFLQEARAVLALNHPNIVTVYDIGKADGVYYIASELIQGETLRTALSRARPELAQSLDIAIQVCAALAAAHEKGVVHRDIKPENVMLRSDGYVKVLDFGIAKLTGQFGGPSPTGAARVTNLATVEGQFIGTAAYMSPEQARGAPVDKRTDVWSSGVLLFEILSGQLPFAGDTTADVVARILERDPAPLCNLAENLPGELQRIVTRALTKNPDERYQTIAEMLSDLKALRQDVEFGEKVRRLSASASPTGVRRTDRRKVVGLSIAFAALGALVGWLSTDPLSSPDIESVAVLPFINASGDPELDYLSDGMTESLINALARLPDLSVKARSMVLRYKGREVDPQEVASALAVEAVVNGRLERLGDRLMLSLSLARGRNGDQIWGERYDSTMTDLVDLHRGMARDVAQQLHTRLSGEAERRVTNAYTSNGEAYQLYLKGRYHVQKVALPEVQTGIRYFEQATAIDPNYALAYVGLADAYRTSTAADIAPALVVPRAKLAAERARAIDDNLSSAHTQLGMLAVWYDWDTGTAERHFERALQLDPNNAEAHLFYAHLRSNQGRHEEAAREATLGLQLEPFNVRFNALEAQFLINAGRTDEALARLQATIALDPSHVVARIFAAAAYIEKGMYQEAIAEAQQAIDTTHRTMAHPLGLLGYALAKSGGQAEARAVLAEMLVASESRYVAPYGIALVYNALGEREETLAWLERGFEARDHKMNLLKVDPKWKNLYGDPRFQALVGRVGF